jgi:two-component system CheB/CheR fusion protein
LTHAIPCRSWNRWSENTWGLRAEEVIGTGFDALDIGLPVHRLRDHLTAVQNGRQDYADQVLEGVDRRGRAILCQVRILPLLDGTNERHGAVMVFQDITEERRAEDYRRYLGRVMDASLGEVYFLDPETLAFRQVNETGQRKLGYSQTQLGTMTLVELAEDVEAAKLSAQVAPLIDGQIDELVVSASLRGQDTARRVDLHLRYFADEVPPVMMATVRGER